MNVGDKLYCKKAVRYPFYEVSFFEVGKYYDVIDVESPFIKVSNGKDHWDFPFSDIYNYFCTLEEVRLMKLKKI